MTPSQYRAARTALLCVGIFLLFMSIRPAPANATISTCAFVKPTPDGFLNLRAEPKMSAKIIKRLKPGQELLVVAETTHSSWIKVEVIVRNQGTGKYLGGWASSRFLRVFDCMDND